MNRGFFMQQWNRICWFLTFQSLGKLTSTKSKIKDFRQIGCKVSFLLKMSSIMKFSKIIDLSQTIIHLEPHNGSLFQLF